MTDPKTHTLDVPGAVLTYDVRSNDALPRFPWPDPAASVRHLVLSLAKVTA